MYKYDSLLPSYNFNLDGSTDSSERSQDYLYNLNLLISYLIYGFYPYGFSLYGFNFYLGNYLGNLLKGCDGMNPGLVEGLGHKRNSIL